MIERVVEIGTGVQAVDCYGDREHELLPGEEDVVRRAVAARRREFGTARACARQAMRQLGVPAVPILAGKGRQPLWPPGVVGSITHCRGYRAAVVADASRIAGIGIDAEMVQGPLEESAERLVLTPEERRRLQAARADGSGARSAWERVVFSAKEALFKCWYPRTGRWLDFHDVIVDLEPDGSFWARFVDEADAGLARFPADVQGSWFTDGRLVVTAVVVPHRAASR